MSTTQNRGGSSDQQSSAGRQESSKSEGNKGVGRGWHGDPEGHARAGSQSHKNDPNRKQ